VPPLKNSQLAVFCFTPQFLVYGLSDLNFFSLAFFLYFPQSP